MKCRVCGNEAVGWVKQDPYDVVSDSPILSEAFYCLAHYNERVIAALLWVKRVEVKR